MGDRHANRAEYVSAEDVREAFVENELRAWERYYARWFAPTPGQLVYERWCASRQTDRARYYARMNPAEREAWENMAAELRERLGPEEWDAFVHFEGRHNVGA